MRLFLVIAVCLAFAGCNQGPPTGTIKGTVKLEGEPVDGGIIRFVPADGNSQPADSPLVSGAYSVTMPLGEKKVEVFWAKDRSGTTEVDTASQGSEQLIQMIPAKYNNQTTLTHTVVEGEQVRDFDLTSK